MNYYSVLKSIGKRSTRKCASKTFCSKSTSYNVDFPPLKHVVHTSTTVEGPVEPFKQVINLDCVQRARTGRVSTLKNVTHQDIVKDLWRVHDNCDILAFDEVRRTYKNNKRMWISVSQEQFIEFGLCKWVVNNHTFVSVRDLYQAHQQRRHHKRASKGYEFQAMGDSSVDGVDEASLGEFFSSDLFRAILRLVIFYRSDNTNRALLLLQWMMENPALTQLPDVTQLLDLLNSISVPSVPSERKEEKNAHAYSMQGADDSDNLSKLHAGIHLLTSMASSNNLRDVLMVVFAVVGITYSAVSHKTVPIDIVKNSAATIGQMLGDGNPVILILKGIGQFITCLRIFFLEGYSGVMNWLVPFQNLGNNYAKAIELINGVKNWNTLEDTQHDRLNIIGVELDGWIIANTKSFNSASRDSNFKYATNQWTTIIRAVTEWKTAVRSYHNATSLRQQPFCVALIGGSGIGKTALQLRVLSIIMRAAGLILTSEEYQQRIFSWDASKEYADGMTLLHKGVNVNEIAAQHWNAMTAAGIKSPVFDLLQILDINPYMTNQAQIENKANIPCHPYGVTLSGNDPDLGINEIFKYPDVIFRRIQHYCIVQVAPEFAAEGGTLDHVKAAAWNSDPDNVGKLEPFWRICVMRTRVENQYSTHGTQGFQIRSHSDMIFPTFRENVQMPERPEDFGPIVDYYAFLAKEARAHHARQRLMVDKVLHRPIDLDVLFQSGEDIQIDAESNASTIETTLDELSRKPIKVAPSATPYELLMIWISSCLTMWCFITSILGFGGIATVFVNWGRILASVQFVGNSITGLIAITGPFIGLITTGGALLNGIRANYVIRRIQGFVRGISQVTAAMAAGARNVSNPIIHGVYQAFNVPNITDELRTNYEQVKRFCIVNLRAIVIACTLFTLYGYFSQKRTLEKNQDFSVKEVCRANVMTSHGEFPVPIALNAQELLIRTQDIEHIRKPELRELRMQMNEPDWNERQLAKLQGKPEFVEQLAFWADQKRIWREYKAEIVEAMDVVLPQADNDNIPRYNVVAQPRVQLMQGAKTTVYSDFQRKVQDNIITISMRTYSGGTTVASDTHGIFITDNLFAMNYHALLQRKLNGWKDITLVVKSKYASKYSEFTISYTSIEKAFADCYHESAFFIFNKFTFFISLEQALEEFFR